jgi:hypothetical protein
MYISVSESLRMFSRSMKMFGHTQTDQRVLSDYTKRFDAMLKRRTRWTAVIGIASNSGQDPQVFLV